MSKTPATPSIHCPSAILGMIQSGNLAQLSGSAIKVYLALKVAGKPFNQATIAKQVGLSTRQAMRCIQSLESAGHLAKSKTGRLNSYTLQAAA